MIILDTDHLSLLWHESSPRRMNLIERLAELVDEPVGTTIVNIEEQMRGWLASVAKEKTVSRQVFSYDKLIELFRFFDAFEIVRFDSEAAKNFDELRKQKIRIGTMDLKIAAISITQKAVLLTANRRDFEQVPGLRFENWLD